MSNYLAYTSGRSIIIKRKQNDVHSSKDFVNPSKDFGNISKYFEAGLSVIEEYKKLITSRYLIYDEEDFLATIKHIEVHISPDQNFAIVFNNANAKSKFQTCQSEILYVVYKFSGGGSIIADGIIETPYFLKWNDSEDAILDVELKLVTCSIVDSWNPNIDKIFALLMIILCKDIASIINSYITFDSICYTYSHLLHDIRYKLNKLSSSIQSCRELFHETADLNRIRC